MTTSDVSKEKSSKSGHPVVRMLFSGVFRLLLVCIIIFAAVAAFRYQMSTSPRAGRQKPPRQAKLVQVIDLERDDCVTTVTEMGTVVPAQQVTLQPQVTGQIVEISDDVIPGCIVEAGQHIGRKPPQQPYS